MTLAAFKRAIQPGVRLTAIEHWNDKMRGKTRIVSKVQTNGYWYANEDEPGRRCYTPHCKSSELQFDGALAVFRLKTGQHWTLRFEPAT